MRKTLLLAVVMIAAQLVATSVIPMSVEDMAVTATHVVRAQAGSSESRWNETGTQIYTYTHFKTLETWKGAPGAEFTVRQMGGRVGNVVQKVSGVRRFNSGDEAVLFLRPSESAGSMAIVGLFQGNFSVSRKLFAEPMASNGVPDAMQVDPSTNSVEHFRAAQYKLSELRARVAKVVGQ